MKLQFAIAVLSLTLIFSHNALGCVCIFSPEPLAPEQVRAARVKDFNDALAVFSGEVITIDTFKVKFKINDLWKGDLDDQITMLTGTEKNDDGTFTSTDCDYEFEPGRKYLVYAYGPALDKLQAHKCTRTMLLKEAGQEIEGLDEIMPRQSRERNSTP
jgi:hypothetical protein